MVDRASVEITLKTFGVGALVVGIALGTSNHENLPLLVALGCWVPPIVLAIFLTIGFALAADLYQKEPVEDWLDKQIGRLVMPLINFGATLSVGASVWVLLRALLV